MHVVDSCGWIEYFADGENAAFFAPAIEDTENLLVPSLVVFEVCRRVLTLQGEPAARQALRFLAQGAIVQLDAQAQMEAALQSQTYKLAMADAIIWHTASVHNAPFYTQDAAFNGLPNVNFRAKPAPKKKK
jgi:toxin FitB